MSQFGFAGLSDSGRVRTENEDRWTVDVDQGLYIVADGMGGECSGGLAAKIVVDTLPDLLQMRLKGALRSTASQASVTIRECLVELSSWLRSESRGQPGLDGMGSTVVLALVRRGHALIGHLGDSRAYLFRNGKLKQLTKDHTIVQLLLDAEEIRPEEATSHPARGQLTRFVGMDSAPLPEVVRVNLRAGDRLLLCSDGLTGMNGDEEMASLMSTDETLETICQRLVGAANEAGGKDNITVLLVEKP